jgi:hypothetical protein
VKTKYETSPDIYAFREEGGRRRNKMTKCKSATYFIHPGAHVHCNILFYLSVVVVVVVVTVVTVVDVQI